MDFKSKSDLNDTHSHLDDLKHAPEATYSMDLEEVRKHHVLPETKYAD